MANKEILIIGSEGFIGSNLIRYFLKKQWNVSGIDHLDNPTQTYNYFKLIGISDIGEILRTGSFTYIVNAAGSGNVGFSIKHPLGDFESNCFETFGILDAIRSNGIKSRYVHISSAAVYGDPQNIPVGEEDSIKPLSPYGWHKYISEILCREYFELYGVRSCIIRPFSVYGPGLKKQLFWDIFNKASASLKIELYGTGEESRDFIYIDDLVRVIDILLQKAEMKAECYNVANGIEIPISESARLFLSYFTKDISVYFNGLVRSGDPQKWHADISKIKNLGYEPEIDIAQGLFLTYLWMEKVKPKT